MKSSCCGSSLYVAGFGSATKWYECDDCGEPCDVRDEAPALDQLQEYWRQNSMMKVPKKTHTDKQPRL